MAIEQGEYYAQKLGLNTTIRLFVHMTSMPDHIPEIRVKHTAIKPNSAVYKWAKQLSSS